MSDEISSRTCEHERHSSAHFYTAEAAIAEVLGHMAQRLDDPPPSYSHARMATPDECDRMAATLRDVIAECMATTPNGRYMTLRSDYGAIDALAEAARRADIPLVMRGESTNGRIWYPQKRTIFVSTLPADALRCPSCGHVSIVDVPDVTVWEGWGGRER